MKKKTIYDLLIYMLIPLLIWNSLRGKLGDYITMLLTTIPGIIYTIYGFVKNKQYSITGIFILVSMFIGRIIDLVAGSAEAMLWNDVYIKPVYILFYITTIIIKKPISMYFALDYASLMGYDREATEKLYRRQELFKHFQYLTAISILRGIEYMFLKAWAINTYGVDGFNTISIITTINGYVFDGVLLFYIIFLSKKIQGVARREYGNIVTDNVYEEC